MNRLWLASIVVFMSIGPACKSSAPKPKPKQKAASEDQVFDPSNNDSDNDTPPVDDCEKNSSSSNNDSSNDSSNDSNDEGSNDEDSGFDLAKFFGLQDTKVTYDSDIKSILAAKCISCHSGTTEPDISTYAAAKNAASKINSEVQAGKMPTSGPLNDNDKQKIQQWLTDGALEKETSDSDDNDSDNDNDSNNSSSSGSNCDNNDSSSSSDDDDDDDEGGDSGNEVADWEEFLNPEGLKDCKDKDKIFDRVKQECHKAKIASFTCDKSGVLAHFKKLGVTVDSTYESIIDDGFEIDQCGEYNDEPIVLFYKKNESSSELNLKIRKLCKKDSEACS